MTGSSLVATMSIQEARKEKERKMTVYLACVRNWTESETVGVFTSKEAALAAAKAYAEDQDCDLSYFTEEHKVQG